MYDCRALQDAIISSGCAACPEDDTTYCDFSSPDDGAPVDEGGKVEGRFLYVYGRVVAVGKDTKGETVSGTCWSRGCVPGCGQQSLIVRKRSPTVIVHFENVPPWCREIIAQQSKAQTVLILGCNGCTYKMLLEHAPWLRLRLSAQSRNQYNVAATRDLNVQEVGLSRSPTATLCGVE